MVAADRQNRRQQNGAKLQHGKADPYALTNLREPPIVHPVDQLNGNGHKAVLIDLRQHQKNAGKERHDHGSLPVAAQGVFARGIR